MFALHETTQRRVCRVTFLVLCVVPTLLTLVGIAYCNRPWRQADWQRTLAQKFHVRAVLDEISRPRPGVTELTNLQLADLRTEHPLGSIDKLRFHRQRSRLTLHADHLTLRAEQLPDLVRAVSTWMATGELGRLDFQADRLTITGPLLQSFALQNLSIRNGIPTAPGQRFQLKALDSAGETIQLALESKAGELSCVIDAQQVPLPVWLVGQLVPGVSSCGDGTFLGEISATYENQHILGQLSGRLELVNLEQWIGDAGPHSLQGIAQVFLEQFTWFDRSIETVQGKIQAERGAVSYSLLVAAANLFPLKLGATWESQGLATPEKLLPYDQLAFEFQMMSEGIKVSGQCGGGALVVAGRTPLLDGPQDETVTPVAMLVQLLEHPRQPGWVPGTRRAHEMSGRLPLPSGDNREPEVMRK